MLKLKECVSKLVIYAVLIFLLAVTVFPIVYTFLASFKSNAEILTDTASILPKQFSFENYIQAWNAEEFNVKLLLWNSIYYTVISVIITVVMSAVGGYVFARGVFPGKKILFGVFTALMFVNLGTITIYPQLKIISLIHLEGSLWGLIVMQAFSLNMTFVYIVSGFIKTLPKSIDEAAIIDGCDFIGIFYKIILPLLLPVMATITILTFQATWNSYLMPSIITLGNPRQRTLIAGVVALKNSGNAAASWNLMLAGSSIAILPVLTVYGFANKFFIAGLAEGAIKE